MKILELIENERPIECLWYLPHQIPHWKTRRRVFIDSMDFSETVLVRMWDEDQEEVGNFTGWYRYDLKRWVIKSINSDKRYSIDINNYLKQNSLDGDLFIWTFIPRPIKFKPYRNPSSLIHLN